METVKVQRPVYWRQKSVTSSEGAISWDNLIAINNKRSLNKAGLLLSVQCALFLPIPFLIIVYFHAPLSVLAVIFTAFAGNIIACMNKPGIRSVTSIFAFCVIDAIVLITFLI